MDNDPQPSARRPARLTHRNKKPRSLAGERGQPHRDQAMSASSKTPAKKAPKGRGGKREGAGRKAAHGEAGVTSGITMPPAYWAMLDAQCGTVGRSGWIMGLILKEDIR